MSALLNTHAKKILLVAGILLLGVNITGFFISLKNPDVYTEEKGRFKNDVLLSDKRFFSIVDQDLANRKIYASKLNEAVNLAIVHYWGDSGTHKYNFRIPFYENFILFGLGYLIPDWFGKWEFFDYKKAVERSAGLCSQHAIIISQILKEKNIPAKMVGLKGHVVVTAQVDEKKAEWWILDGDYGVVIEHNINEIEKQPEIVRPFYQRKGYDSPTIQVLVDIYGKEGNSVSKLSRHYPERYYFETLSYILKWIIPFGLMVPYVRRGENRARAPYQGEEY